MHETNDRRGLLSKNKADLKKMIEDEHKKHKAKLEIDSIEVDDDQHHRRHHIEEILTGDHDQPVTLRPTPRRNILADIEDEEEKEELEKEMFMSLPATRHSKRKEKSIKTRNIKRNMDAQLFICQVCSKFVIFNNF
jgi:hypothetical protein